MARRVIDEDDTLTKIVGLVFILICLLLALTAGCAKHQPTITPGGHEGTRLTGVERVSYTGSVTRLRWYWVHDGENVDGFYFYWSLSPTSWSGCSRIDVYALHLDDYSTSDPPEPLPGELWFINVTAHNAAGESTDEGEPINAAQAREVVPCGG